MKNICITDSIYYDAIYQFIFSFTKAKILEFNCLFRKLSRVFLRFENF